MKKQKILFVLILVLFAVVVSFGQNVVKDTSNVKKPSEGKLYYQKKDKSLYLYREGKFEIDNKFDEKIEVDPPIVILPPNNADKIILPVGVIRWDSYGTEGGITPGLRAAFSFPETENHAPFYSTFTNPEYLDFTYYDQNDSFKPKTEKRLSQVKFNGDRPGVIEKECDYAKSAGIDFWAFNYYPDEATQAYARNQFIKLSDKRGLKMAYITELVAIEDRIINHFIDQFRKDWYQKIDGKPLLILAVNSKSDLDGQIEFKNAVESKCQCKTYSVLQSNDWASDKVQTVMQYGLNAASLYGTWNGATYKRRDHKYIIEQELIEWNNFLNYPQMDLGLNITMSFSNAGVFRSPLNQKQSEIVYYAENMTGYLATDSENRQQFKNAIEFIKNNPNKAKYVMLYSWNEHTEGVRTVSPVKKKNGEIDDSVLKIVKEFVD